MVGTGELLVILCLVLLLFGGKRLPELARQLGIGIREFKDALSGESSAKGFCSGGGCCSTEQGSCGTKKCCAEKDEEKPPCCGG